MPLLVCAAQLRERHLASSKDCGPSDRDDVVVVDRFWTSSGTLTSKLEAQAVRAIGMPDRHSFVLVALADSLLSTCDWRAVEFVVLGVRARRIESPDSVRGGDVPRLSVPQIPSFGSCGSGVWRRA